jgi:hypothetical protein
MADYTTVIKRDAENKTLSMAVYNASGVLQTSYGNITLLIGSSGSVTIDLADLTGTNKAAEFREFRWLDKDTCDEYKAWILMTEPEAV